MENGLFVRYNKKEFNLIGGNCTMALIKCPECGKEISDQANICPHCGYEIIAQNEYMKKENKEIPIYKNRKYISILMCVIGCIFLIGAITRITNDDYKFYKQHYQDCMDGYNDTKAIADSYWGGYFESSYNSIATSYKDMADDDNKELRKFRIQALILGCGGLILIICGCKNYNKGEKRKWR